MYEDMLVKLYELPPLEAVLATQAEQGITVRRAIGPERGVVVDWVEAHFGLTWRSECEVAFGHQPIGCFVAISERQMLGFACVDATARGFFGPTGVDENQRGRGIGKALLLIALHDLRQQGYGYGIIGGAGPQDFYARAVGATVIPGSNPGVYQGMLRPKKAVEED